MPLEKALNLLKRIAFEKPPRNPYNPDRFGITSFFKKFKEVERAEGFGGAYNKLRNENVFRTGNFVGTDYNGNKYYENPNAPYGRSRWVEYPTVSGVWAIEDKMDASMVAPDWHGWLHYMHDIPGSQVDKHFGKPFKQQLPVNQTMLRSHYTGRPASEDEFHQPPGTWGTKIARGRLGPKYESWLNGSEENKELKNFADNSKRLDIP